MQTQVVRCRLKVRVNEMVNWEWNGKVEDRRMWAKITLLTFFGWGTVCFSFNACVALALWRKCPTSFRASESSWATSSSWREYFKQVCNRWAVHTTLFQDEPGIQWANTTRNKSKTHSTEP